MAGVQTGVLPICVGVSVSVTLGVVVGVSMCRCVVVGDVRCQCISVSVSVTLGVGVGVSVGWRVGVGDARCQCIGVSESVTLGSGFGSSGARRVGGEFDPPGEADVVDAQGVAERQTHARRPSLMTCKRAWYFSDSVFS